MKFMDDEVGQFINWQHHMIEQKDPLPSPPCLLSMQEDIRKPTYKKR